MTITTGTAAPPTRREETRRDRLAAAQIERDAAETRARIQIERERAWEDQRRRARADKDARKAAARARRAYRRAALSDWTRAHTAGLLFVPVIVVPAVLSWSAMAAYGESLYGPAGLVLPALSEGGQWVFAIATTLRHRDNERRAGHGEPARPLWHLRLGTAIFTAYAAALNFLHGIPHGPAIAASMALVSVAGIVAHQLITAGPRRSRAERHAARIGRDIARRELAARRAAVRDAAVDLDEGGRAALVFEPGSAVLQRRRLRTRLAPVPPGPVREDPRTEPGPAPARTDQPPAAPRTDPPGPEAGTRTEPAATAAPPAPAEAGAPLASTARPVIVAMLAGQLRDAVDTGQVWRPDYEDLMASTGRRRSWCEKAVRDARNLMLTLPPPDAVRADDEPADSAGPAVPRLHPVPAGPGEDDPDARTGEPESAAS